jgi:hypothetical protein
MGVDYGYLEISMAQEFLDRPNVITVFEKLGCEIVPEGVNRSHQTVGRINIKEFITGRNPFDIKGHILGFYRTSSEKILFECLKHNRFLNYTDSV